MISNFNSNTCSVTFTFIAFSNIDDLTTVIIKSFVDAVIDCGIDIGIVRVSAYLFVNHELEEQMYPFETTTVNVDTSPFDVSEQGSI